MDKSDSQIATDGDATAEVIAAAKIVWARHGHTMWCAGSAWKTTRHACDCGMAQLSLALDALEANPPCTCGHNDEGHYVAGAPCSVCGCSVFDEDEQPSPSATASDEPASRPADAKGQGNAT